MPGSTLRRDRHEVIRDTEFLVTPRPRRSDTRNELLEEALHKDSRQTDCLMPLPRG